ncbi:MAG: hypothetical protein QM811_21455 [Pirellulales bacterium]
MFDTANAFVRDTVKIASPDRYKTAFEPDVVRAGASLFGVGVVALGDGVDVDRFFRTWVVNFFVVLPQLLLDLGQRAVESTGQFFRRIVGYEFRGMLGGDFHVESDRFGITHVGDHFDSGDFFVITGQTSGFFANQFLVRIAQMSMPRTDLNSHLKRLLE